MPVRASVVALALFFIAGCAVDDPSVATSASPSASTEVVVGEPAGEVVESGGAAAATATPLPTATPTTAPTPTATESVAVGGWEVLACSSISGDTCNGELDSLDGVGRFVALVRFDSASAGDAIEAVLDGPSGPISSGPYTLQGSGRGYYYAELSASLPPGDYTLTALRNGTPVAERVLPGG